MSKQKGVCLFAYNNDQLDYGTLRYWPPNKLKQIYKLQLV